MFGGQSPAPAGGGTLRLGDLWVEPGRSGGGWGGSGGKGFFFGVYMDETLGWKHRDGKIGK